MALYRSTDYQPSFKLIGLQEKKFNVEFQEEGHGHHLGFPTGTFLDIFYLQVTLILLMKFQVNWLFSLGEENQNIYSTLLPWRSSWISNWNDLCYF